MTTEEYFKDISARLLEYCKEGYLCDSVIVAGGKALKAHSVMLAAASPQLKRELDKQIEYDMHYFVLPNIDYETLCIAVYFIYTGNLMLSRQGDDEYHTELKESLINLGLSAARINECQIFYESNRELEFNGVPSIASVNTKQSLYETTDVDETSDPTNLKQMFQKTDSNNQSDIVQICNKNSSLRRSNRIKLRNTRNRFSKKRSANKKVSNKIESDNGQQSTLAANVHQNKYSNMMIIEEFKTGANVEMEPLDALLFNSEASLEYKDSASSAVERTAACNTALHKVSSYLNDNLRCEDDYLTGSFSNHNLELREIHKFTVEQHNKESRVIENKNSIEELAMVDNIENTQKDLSKDFCKLSCGTKRKYKCQECLDLFSTQKALTLHMNSHSLCSSQENKSATLLILGRPHLCSSCDRGFKTESGLKHHQTMSHPTQHNLLPHGSLLCHICGGKFKSRGCLRNHLMRPHTEHLCSVCGKSFYNLSKLSVHTLVEHGTKLKRYPKRVDVDLNTPTYLCAFCGYSSSSIKAFSAHRRSHRRICSICSARFEGDSTLDDHVRLAHPGEKCLPQNWCSMCEKAFSSERSLKEHQLLHTNKRPFVCKTCGKSFASLRVLGSHVRLHCVKRDGEGDGHKFKRKPQERKSMLQPSKPLRQEKLRYSCTSCDKVFLSEMSRMAHMVTHTGTLPFSCPQCDKKFYYKGYLKTHMLIHTGELPYTCSVCAKAFRQAAHLKTHMHIHEGTKPYSCEECNKGYLSRVDLRNHYSRVHNLDVVRTKINKHHSYTVTRPDQPTDTASNNLQSFYIT